jgi:DNA-binding NtrC family response regulator
VARALHRFSARRDGPFVAVNCAALPETLLESELFGHEKGAYTGAATQHKGRFELAHQGTLFLDEIGDLPLALQVKLLRVLQERSFERLGGTESISVDVRVIAATHKDLTEELEHDRFRADLFYRLSVLSIHVPPLRTRKSDVLGLWEHFVAEGTSREHRAPLKTSAAAQCVLLRHQWPGNIRELQNVAEHALTVALGDTIGTADLPEYLAEHSSRPDPRRSLAGLTMKEVERLSILDTYEALGTVKASAEALGISERKIHYRLKEYRKGVRGTGRRRRKTRPSTQTPIAPRPTVRILLAEDDDEVRWALAEFLRTEGYEVVAVPDGKALLEHLGSAMLLEQRDAPPDIIITDVRMPGLTGMQLLESVRNRGWTTPVVLISAFGDDETRRKADGLGATAFLDKPIDVGRLHRIIGGL